MAWTNALSAEPGNFTVILSLLTQANGIVLDNIYSEIESWCAVTGNSFEEILSGSVAINCGEVEGVNGDSIASLTSLGLIASTDNVHIAPTTLGAQFIATVRGTPGSV